jgi:RNA polymerase sigma factor (sigma-70 family)
MLNTKQPPDDVLQGCLRGERRAMEVFYKKHFPALYPVAARYARDDLEAREILNSAMLKIFQGLPHYHADRPLMPWMKTLVIHTGLDSVKSKARRQTTAELEQAAELYVDDSRRDTLIDLETLHYLLRQIPDLSRAVFTLFAVEGYSHREIAAQLDITDNNSRWHLHTARQSLIKLLRQHESEKKHRPAAA